jgi:hypothetical protein
MDPSDDSRGPGVVRAGGQGTSLGSPREGRSPSAIKCERESIHENRLNPIIFRLTIINNFNIMIDDERDRMSNRLWLRDSESPGVGDLCHPLSSISDDLVPVIPTVERVMDAPTSGRSNSIWRQIPMATAILNMKKAMSKAAQAKDESVLRTKQFQRAANGGSLVFEGVRRTVRQSDGPHPAEYGCHHRPPSPERASHEGAECGIPVALLRRVLTRNQDLRRRARRSAYAGTFGSPRRMFPSPLAG